MTYILNYHSNANICDDLLKGYFNALFSTLKNIKKICVSITLCGMGEGFDAKASADIDAEKPADKQYFAHRPHICGGSAGATPDDDLDLHAWIAEEDAKRLVRPEHIEAMCEELRTTSMCTIKENWDAKKRNRSLHKGIDLAVATEQTDSYVQTHENTVINTVPSIATSTACTETLTESDGINKQLAAQESVIHHLDDTDDEDNLPGCLDAPLARFYASTPFIFRILFASMPSPLLINQLNQNTARMIPPKVNLLKKMN